MGTGTLLNQTTKTIPSGGGETQEGITFGTPTWKDGKASITVNTEETEYSIEYKLSAPDVDTGWTTIENNGTISELSHGSTVYARLTDGVNHGDYATKNIQDEINPVVDVKLDGLTTSSSIKVNVTASDNESGMAASPTYTYYIKQSSEEDTAYVAKANNIAENTYTFTGLTQGTSYDIEVEVTGDNAGNTGAGYLAGQITATIPDGSGEDVEEGAITFGAVSWSSGKASISVSTNTSYQIEYQVGAITEENWTGIANNGTISNLNYADTVYARLTDGVNHGEYAVASIDDKTNPQAATISLSGNEATTKESITATVTLVDNESGVDVTGSKWVYNTNAGNIGTDEGSYTNNFTTNPEELTLSADTAGTYYLHVLTKDVAGNKEETISEAITVAEPTIENVLIAGDWVRYEDGTGVSRDCVVLYDSTSEYGVEIITMETVEDVELGNGTGSIQTNNTTYFNTAMNSYNTAISTLNNATSKYLNTAYADASRSVGSDPSNPTSDNPGYFTSNYSYMSSYNGQFKNEDTHYETDLDQVHALGIHAIDERYWLASRQVYSDSTSSIFRVCFRGTGNITFDVRDLCSVYSFGMTGSHSYTYGLRPVFHLKPDVIVTGGSGTEEDPYILYAEPIPTISETESQVGNYADVDGNGSVDGVIYADLAIGGSGQWTDSDGTFTIPKGSNFRDYTESGTHTASGFGTKGVIKATSTSGNERFYVMALSDVDSSTHCWYNRAYGNMSDYASTTSGDFGTGEKNTQTMISKWNSSAYGAQTTTGSFPDMWGLSTVQSGTWNGSTGWYVPSRGEWAAFASQLGITKSNYTSFGLSLSYWSSSQSTTRGAWLAYFSIGYMNNGNVNTTYYVRLGTTY